MGPLIPQGFVNADLNLFFAFVIGLGFGYVLENAGFSSSRKLAGVFYGYDFVVLRVFFTAAITAMTGLLLFSYMGWIDYRLLFINPTFLWSAIVGGVIMGFGFILGGFCPGTSLTAAVIGKVDAIVFIAGMFIGIYIFGEFYEVFEPLYNGSFLGNIFVYESLGMGREWFAILLIVMAIMAFVVTQMIEDKVNNTSEIEKHARPSYWIPSSIVIAASLLLLILPAQPRSHWNETAPDKLLSQIAAGEHYFTIDEAAYRLVNGRDMPVLFVDVRSSEEFNSFALPGAMNIPIGMMLDQRYKAFLESSDQRIVFYSNSGALATQAWLIAARAGMDNVHVLQGGLNGFVQTIFVDEPFTQTQDITLLHQARFREKARNYFLSGKATPDVNAPATPVIKLIEVEMPAKGGC
jgi:rhodanese-related sulfurtransferase/uncharacterized membrane protein YedE/YeeE